LVENIDEGLEKALLEYVRQALDLARVRVRWHMLGTGIWVPQSVYLLLKYMFAY